MRRLAASMRGFVASEAGGGIALMAASALAMIVANSPLAGTYFQALHAEAGPLSVHLWINDALMALFFFVVGLEIKSEFVGGRLASWEQRRLPVIAAAAGMAVPALVFLAVAGRAPGLANGWAIPAATDIAFAMGVMALLGRHAPPPLRLFLTTVAIVDDLGAILIIAIAYGAHLDPDALMAAGGVLAVMVALNRWGVVRLWPYLLLAVLLWFFVFQSGVHATVAGVAAALTIPMTPLHRLEAALNPWVAFGVVPLFGFANAGVSLAGLSPAILWAPLPLAIALGLLLGKQMGIFGSVWLAVKLRIAPAPGGWAQLYGVALVAGIGFTMSLFIGGLAFPARPELADQVKIGVLAGSLLSALAGACVLRFASAKAGA